MYSIEQLAMCTGLTTRTLRNYLKSGMLKGNKDSGCWLFTEQQVSEFITHPAVRPSIQAKHNSIALDFLLGQEADGACILINRTMTQSDAKKAADFFCRAVSASSHIRFSYSYEGTTAHFILKGPEAELASIMDAFRLQKF